MTERRPPGGGKSGSGRSGGKPGTSRALGQRVFTARGRSTSSTMWLQRQLNDPYVVAAKQQGYRSRAAFKLLELDEKFNLLKGRKRVLDLGAAPGGWTQVAVERLGPSAVIVATDIQAMDPIAGATVLQIDAFTPDAPEQFRQALGGFADLVLSDMAPSTTGHGRTDQIRILALAEAAFETARHLLAPGGAFAAKLFQGGAHGALLDELKRQFTSVRHAKPPSSRKDSSEMFLVATGFRGAAPVAAAENPVAPDGEED